MSEFAPGIPSKKTSHELPEVRERKQWEYGLQEHEAERAGHHFDLRLGDPDTAQAHSWALRRPLPRPGEWDWAIQQPTHTLEYMDWEGTIPTGTYGGGKVRLADRDRTEIMNARPGHVSFNVYRGSGPEEYTLHRIRDNKWKIFNRTIDRTRHPDIPDSKPAYKERSPSRVDLDDDRYLASAKIDDAHNLFYLPKDNKVRAFSYRRGKRRGIIEHTHKVPTLMDGIPVPKELSETVLRGGLYARHPRSGKAVKAKDLASLLNSDVWKSREKQFEIGPLIPVLYDVAKFKGKDMEGAPYEEKLQAIGEVMEKMPGVFEVPPMAISPDEKKDLVQRIATGRLPETEEGIVLWNKKEPNEKPIRVKFHKDFDVYIRDFFPGKGKYEGRGVGGFTYSHSKDGPIVGRVGTGLTDEQRLDMFRDPQKYIGTVARVQAKDKYRSGALRAPAFKNFHLDKNPREVLDMLKTAEGWWESIAYEPELEFLWGDAIA